ncbi:MAG: phosphatase PAP2 family protein [Candidatus Kapabacteria bacterium]|nr:phosphatase PAP2 family protein [Candidatus Kapabacteria bacterium]
MRTSALAHLRWIAPLFTVITCTIWWVDAPVAQWMHANTTAWMRMIGTALDHAGQSHWVLGYCLLVALFTWRTRRRVATDHLWWFSAVAASGIIANIIKVLAGRPRPPLAIESGIVAWDPLAWHVEFLWNSFPSGHATTGLCIAIMGSALYPRLSWLFWPLGVSIALARVVLNVHYVSDVMVGSLIGAAVAVMMKRRMSDTM